MSRAALLAFALVGLAVGHASPAASQETCWLAAGEFVDTQPGPGETPGYAFSVESYGDRCWANVRLLSLPGQPFADTTTSYYAEDLEPLILVPPTARAYGCPYGAGDAVDMLAFGRDWDPVTQSGEGWIPATIAAATDRCRYDVAAYVDGALTTFNPLHDQLRLAALPRLTAAEIAAQLQAAIERRTCAPGGMPLDYRGDTLGALVQEAAAVTIRQSWPSVSVFMRAVAIGEAALVTPDSAFAFDFPNAMPGTELHPVRIEALICTPSEHQKSEEEWAFALSCYIDRRNLFVCQNEGGERMY